MMFDIYLVKRTICIKLPPPEPGRGDAAEYTRRQQFMIVFKAFVGYSGEDYRLFFLLCLLIFFV
jgi:hypothetical protein